MRLLLRFFFFFMVALVIPVIGGGLYFASQLRSIEDDVLTANSRALALVREIIDSTGDRLSLMLRELRRDPALQPLLFMEYPIDPARVTEVTAAHRNSLISRIQDPFLIDIFAYFSAPRVLLTRNQIFLSTAAF